MQARLQRAGYSVQCAEGGAEALSLLRTEPVDMVLADLRMPGISGIELLRRIRETHPGTPVAIVTAYSSSESRADAIRAGATGFLTKPVQDEDLFGLVEGVLNG